MNTQRTKGGFDQALYRLVFGFANEYKEGDEAIGVAASDSATRENARKLLLKRESGNCMKMYC
ncbi:MAG: hypothetical protein NTU74_20310 [Deltaproteobacteria bacterium]|nr:hypothetical protein [Deltaproteobacteria bacterium]